MKNKKRIVLVDDEPRYIYILKLNLETRGYEVVTAGDGEEAIILAATTKPDLIILDIAMPNMDGYEACRRIREFSTAPVIFVTARAEEANKMKGLELGAADYITKPFGIDEFLVRIESVLQRKEFSCTE